MIPELLMRLTMFILDVSKNEADKIILLCQYQLESLLKHRRDEIENSRNENSQSRQLLNFFTSDLFIMILIILNVLFFILMLFKINKPFIYKNHLN